MRYGSNSLVTVRSTKVTPTKGKIAQPKRPVVGANVCVDTSPDFCCHPRFRLTPASFCPVTWKHSPPDPWLHMVFFFCSSVSTIRTLILMVFGHVASEMQALESFCFHWGQLNPTAQIKDFGLQNPYTKFGGRTRDTAFSRRPYFRNICILPSWKPTRSLYWCMFFQFLVRRTN